MTVRIKIRVCTILFSLLFVGSLFAQDFIELKSLPRNFEFEISNVDVVILPVDGDKMEYATELSDGCKLSCVEHRGNFRVRSLYKTEGTLYVKVPKDYVFEQIRITSSMANIRVEGIRAVNFILVCTRGDVSVLDSAFKTSNVVHNLGQLEFSVNVLRASAICVNYVNAEIFYVGEPEMYHIDYGQGMSSMYVLGEKVKPRQGIWGLESAKKRTIVSAGNSRVNILFKPRK